MGEQVRVKLSNGIELDVVDEGPRDAPVLMFLHGFPESHRTWRHQIAHFSDRFRCIAPDQRGYRGSSKPQAVEDYTPDKLIGDIFLLADALGVERFTVIGHDWGGAIAWGVALGGQMNGRVTRAVVANAPHPAVFQKLLYTDPVQREASQYMRGFRDPRNDALVREQGLAGLLLQEIRWDRPDAMEPAERAALLSEWQDRDAAFAMLNWYRASPIDIPPLDAPYDGTRGLVAATPAEADHSDAGDLGDGRSRPPARESRRAREHHRGSDAGRGARLRAFRALGSAGKGQSGDGRLPCPYPRMSRTNPTPTRPNCHGGAPWPA